jgi:hypothetical protein
MAMNMDAVLNLRANVDGANKIVELNRGLKTMEGTAKGLTGAMRGLTGASAGLSGALGALAPLASVAGLVGLAKGALDLGDKMNDLSQSTGVSVESLSRFRKAASTSGTDIDSVAKAMVKLSKSMLEASVGSKQQVAAFKALGINVTDSNGKLKAADSVMLEIANRFKQMPDGVAKTALALKYFGRSGAEMIPMLNMGGDAIDKLSVKMTTAFAQKADEYNDKLAMLSGKIGALGADLLIALLPALTAVTDAVSAGVGAFNSLPGPIKSVAIGGAMLAIAWGPISGLVTGAGAAFIAGAAAIGTLRVQIALAAMQEIPALSAAIMMIPGWGWALAGVAAISALGAALYLNNQDFKNWVDNVVNIVATDFKGAMDSIANGAKDAFKKAADAGDWFNKKTKEIAASIPKGFANGFSQMVQIAQQKFAQMQAIVMGWWARIPAPVRGMLSGGAKALGTAVQMLPGVYPTMVALEALGKGPVNKGKGKGRGTGADALAGYYPDLSALDGSGGAGKSGKSAADKAAREAKKEAEEKAKRLLESQKGLAISEAELRVAQALNSLDKAAAEYALRKLRIEQDFAGKLEDIKTLSEGSIKQQIQINIEAAKKNELEKLRLEYLKQQTAELLRQAGIDSTDFGSKPTGFDWKDAVQYQPSAETGLQGEQQKNLDEARQKAKEDLKEMASLSNQVKGAAQAIGESFANSFQGVITGAMSAKEALRSFFGSIAKYFLDMATKMIAKWIEMQIIGLASSLLSGFSGSGGFDLGKNFNSAGAGSTGISWGDAIKFKRAVGGPVTGNASYMVGERGPELFTPSNGGNITPNNRLRDVMGSSPASGGNGPMLNMTFETTRFGDTEYVSRDQLERAMAQTRRQAANEGAKRGMGMTLDKLQQSPQTRSRVGIR